MRRRSFLIAGGGGLAAVALGLWRLSPTNEHAPAGTGAKTVAPAALPVYGDWTDLYRQQWTWDRIARGTHSSANCLSACAWNLYVRDGVVWREEQSAPYKASNASVPDFNPRGCQKGACYSNLAAGPTRIKYPLRRVGERGQGLWKRISWDEALDEIAVTLVDVLGARGGEGAICELGGHLDYGPTMTSALRFFRQIGAPVTDATPMVGDLPVGGTITFGDPFIGGSSDDWFRSDYLVLWAFNPSTTRIPDAHFLNEARYRGARVVSIAPDFNQSAIHADLWMGVRPGTDAALALAACHVVVEEGLYRTDYVCEQTDLPFLVRDDTHRFVRQSDVMAGGSDTIFAIWDGAAKKLVWTLGSEGSEDKTLAVPQGVRPDLEARAQVRLLSGQTAAVRTVFSLMRERLAGFSPEKAATITGVSAPVIRGFARDFAGARSALILAQFGMCKNYHSDLAQRSQILLASLTGNHGKSGGGWHSCAFVALDGVGLVAMQDKLDLAHLLLLGAEAYLSPAQVRARFMDIYVSSTLFHAWHGGLAKIQAAPEHGDPALPEGAAPYLREALEKGHFPIGAPIDGPPPEVFVCLSGNVLRHSRMGNRLRDGLFAKARLVVDLSLRMSETARHADILLPAAGWYEKVGVKYVPAYAPYVTMSDKAVEPAGESKPEWEIFALLAERVAAEARRRGVLETKGFRGNTCDIANLGERFTDDGRFGPHDGEKVVDFILKTSQATKGITLADLRDKGGAVRLTGVGPGGGDGIHSDYSPDEPVVAMRDFVEKKQPYPTLTGRQQFYIDHPWFLRLDEQLPTHKDPPTAGGNHPFTMTGGHTRWSIHAIWRDHALLMRLQRGEPVVFVNEADARDLGVGDHDPVRVWNDIGTFQARAKITGAIRPGQLHIFHAWEPYQFRSRDSHQALIASPLKVTQLVGDYGQL
ncbi:MAG: molybdopterin-dependent oxidoreductase, partial [Deltaproteobacteria bacterium]|nr:molybdopterin-dependent oxidoreductase [Deltaproteobacteria bacterium]